MDGILPACMYVYLLAFQVPTETEECAGFLRLELKDNRYPPCGSWDSNPDPWEEQSVLLTKPVSHLCLFPLTFD